MGLTMQYILKILDPQVCSKKIITSPLTVSVSVIGGGGGLNVDHFANAGDQLLIYYWTGAVLQAQIRWITVL